MHGNVSFGGMTSSSAVGFAQGSDLMAALNQGGKWFVVAEFNGRIRGWKFADVNHHDASLTAKAAQGAGDSILSDPLPSLAQEVDASEGTWVGPARDSWSSSLSADEYQAAVAKTRAHVAEGAVYQANICRVLRAPLPIPGSARSLAHALAQGNPAPYLGYAQVDSVNPDEQVWLASASPELFFKISKTISGATISSSPIKGTAVTADQLLEKDRAENVMITDLVRNDISPLCVPGSVAVRGFLNVEQHPGLVHLVSTVEGTIADATLHHDGFWNQVFDALFPPGSVSGAPKSSALRIIESLESHTRGPYCGGFGWIDADSMEAELAVGIRSFWWEADCADCAEPTLHFGTGAGITWGSDPEQEWQETQLKASRLISLASRKDVQ